MKTRNLIFNILIALIVAIVVVFANNHLVNSSERKVANRSGSDKIRHVNIDENYNVGKLDFVNAADHTLNGVVHVKVTKQRERSQVLNPFDFFFGQREREEQPRSDIGFGSGVIISEDGYIVTNYHVIREADEIEVTLHDHRTYIANVQGTDVNTDIALIKIEDTNLPYISFGDSDELRIGEWVLAVGNPFGLTSSVTAGIISAKERTLGVLSESEMPMESFLQTDAAVNVGNSGGALVNLRGELVGIPTLIISPTRTHIGNAFAVPSAIVERVKEDLIEYGEVRRGVLGVSIMEVTSELASEKGLEELEGVYVVNVIKGSAADQAGIQSGDVIFRVNDNSVNTTGALQQQISRHHPGDRVEIWIMRNGTSMVLTARLIGMEDHRELVMQQEVSLLGATFKRVPEDMQRKLNLPGGVQVTEIGEGELQAVGMREGFIIVSINRQLIREPAQVMQLLDDYSGNVYIEGFYPDGTSSVYAFSI